VLTNPLAENEKALEELRCLGRRRLKAMSQDNHDLIPEGSGRAVTPDCSPVPRGSINTVEAHDHENDIHLERRREYLLERFATEADYLLSIMAAALAD
jgi:hypothetical protein